MGGDSSQKQSRKEEIRRMIGKKRGELDLGWIEEKSRAIQRELTSLPEFAEAGVVCCYLSMPGEVRTDLIMDKCRRKMKTVCVPAFCRGSDRYELTRLEADMPVVEGHLKVPEPEEPDWISAKEVDLMAVPGVAFDIMGSRLGRGGGNYDRLMGSPACNPAKRGSIAGRLPTFKIGLAFEFQMFDRVPMDEKDVKLDAVITEKRVIRTGII